MSPNGQRFLGVTAALCGFAVFFLCWYRANECAHTEGCGAYHEAYDKSGNRVISEPIGESSPDVLLARYTFWLTLLTGGLVLATGTQGYLLIRAERVALKMAKTTRRQVRLARREFAAAHRPRLRVRNIVIDPMEPFPGGGIGNSPIGVGLIKGSFLIANHGDSTAYIVEGYSCAYVTDEVLPMARPYEEGISYPFAREGIQSGYAKKYWIDQDVPVTLTARAATDIASGSVEKLYVMGWIVYEDDAFVRRRTAFCREYDANRHRFYAINDPDYEHEE